MNMKNLIAVAAFVLCNVSVSSQTTRIEGGINLANVSITDNGRVDDAKMLTSFQLGVMGDFHLVSIVYLQPGLFFTGKGTKTQSGDPSTLNYSKATSNPYYIEIPVNFLFKTPKSSSTNNRFFVGAGPYLAIGVAGKIKNEGKIAGIGYKNDRKIEFSNDDPTTLDYEEGAGFGILKRFDYGMNGVAGIDGKSMVLSVKYGLGLAKLQSGGNSSADNNNKHRVLSFTIGFKF